MRKYETVFISDPDLSGQSRSDLFDKVRNIIAKSKGIILDFEEWGNKRLAYEIKKKLRGHYVCITYGGTGELVKELERNFRLTDDILKFMTLNLSDDTTVQALEKEMVVTEETSDQTETAAKEVSEAPAEAVEEAPAEENVVQTKETAE